MRKKKRKNKKARKQKNIKTRTQKTDEPTAVFNIRADLKKTVILTAVGLVILIALSLTQPRWTPVF
jgi:hypothetical protein